MEKESVIAALGALAHESRLDVFRYLMQQGATLSFHLSALRHARLVRNRRDGRSIIYTADFEAMNAVLAYLTENCCQGRPEDCAIPQCDTVARPPENAPRRSAVRQRLKP